MRMMSFLSDLTLFGGIQLYLVGLVTFLLAFNYFTKERWRKLPPGPPNLPIVGSMLFLGADIREPLRKMAAKYGDVFTIYLGTRRVVVLSGYEVIKEAFMNKAHAFSGRPSISFLDGITEGYGIVSVSGERWREQRRHALHVLKDFGLGRTLLEERIIEEVGFCIEALRQNTDRPFHPANIIQMSVGNVIASVTYGQRYDYDNPLFIKYIEIMNHSFKVIGASGVLNLFPFLRFLPGDLFEMKELRQDTEFMKNEQIQRIQKHQADYSRDKEPRDFIDAYLRKIDEESGNPHTTFTVRQLLGIVGDFFGAGTETTTTTLVWAIIYLTLNPDVQTKIYSEIDEVTDRDEVPRMQLRQELPYTEACICEVQRMGDIVPFSVPHETTEDVELRGYLIPSGTTIFSSLYSTNMDPDVWKDPDQFRPERFLDQDGRLAKREEFIPFSIGKRQCLGEGLARMELFLYFTSLVKNFRFRQAPGYPAPDTHGYLSITNMPQPFHIIMESRA